MEVQEKRGPGRPPNVLAVVDDRQFLKAVSFHAGYQFGNYITTTGLNAEHHTKRFAKPVKLWRTNGQVNVTIGDEMFIVPDSNIIGMAVA